MKCFNCQQDGHLARDCQWAPEIEDKPLPQFARCTACGAHVYAWERNAPCDKHRTVAAWRAYYHSPDFAADYAEAHRDDATPHEKDPLRAEAARQVAEYRAAHPVI